MQRCYTLSETPSSTCEGQDHMKLLERLPLRRKAAEPEKPRGRFAVLEDMVVERLQLRRIQAFYDDLIKLEPYWLIVLPLLIWVFRRTYIRERQLVLERKRAAQL
jgi:hypothetical protein